MGNPKKDRKTNAPHSTRRAKMAMRPMPAPISTEGPTKCDTTCIWAHKKTIETNKNAMRGKTFRVQEIYTKGQATMRDQAKHPPTQKAIVAQTGKKAKQIHETAGTRTFRGGINRIRRRNNEGLYTEPGCQQKATYQTYIIRHIDRTPNETHQGITQEPKIP